MRCINTFIITIKVSVGYYIHMIEDHVTLVGSGLTVWVFFAQCWCAGWGGRSLRLASLCCANDIGTLFGAGDFGRNLVFLVASSIMRCEHILNWCFYFLFCFVFVCFSLLSSC